MLYIENVILIHRECQRTAPRRGWKTIDLKGKKTSLINFRCRNVSTCAESIAAHTRQSINTPLVVILCACSTQCLLIPVLNIYTRRKHNPYLPVGLIITECLFFSLFSLPNSYSLCVHGECALQDQAYSTGRQRKPGATP